MYHHAFCRQLNFISWLQKHLLPCPFKYLSGIDCPGCGFQRSMVALMQGNVHNSFRLYPATIPLLLLFAYTIADRYLKLDTRRMMVKKTLYMIVGSIILISYGIKMWGMCQHIRGTA